MPPRTRNKKRKSIIPEFWAESLITKYINEMLSHHFAAQPGIERHRFDTETLFRFYVNPVEARNSYNPGDVVQTERRTPNDQERLHPTG